MGPKDLFTDETPRLAALDDGRELVGERPRLIRVAEHPAALAGRGPELAENLGLRELLVAHFGSDRVDEADAFIKVVVALPTLLVHAAEDEFHARLGREIVGSGYAG